MMHAASATDARPGVLVILQRQLDAETPSMTLGQLLDGASEA